jgi:DNA-binding transcriptional LysR family regulator
MDSLGSLNAFVLAAENRSFTVAGRRLGVSSSAVGKAVAPSQYPHHHPDA